MSLALAPAVLGLLFAFWLVANFDHRQREQLRIHGVAVQTVISRTYSDRQEKGSPFYQAEYTFPAVDPDAGRLSTFTDDAPISCLQFRALRPGAPIQVIYDPRTPDYSRVDYRRRFRPGMSPKDFEAIWQPDNQDC